MSRHFTEMILVTDANRNQQLAPFVKIRFSTALECATKKIGNGSLLLD